VFAFGEPNLQILERKLFFDFKNPFKITAEAEPEPRTRMNSVRDKLREGEATPSQKAGIVKWRCLLDKIRTYFEQNPDPDF
jgi:hypothetical protein